MPHLRVNPSLALALAGSRLSSAAQQQLLLAARFEHFCRRRGVNPRAHQELAGLCARGVTPALWHATLRAVGRCRPGLARSRGARWGAPTPAPAAFFTREAAATIHFIRTQRRYNKRRYARMRAVSRPSF